MRGVDIRVGAGEILAVFGPNGAGKTTLVKILAGIMRPTAGSVLINGVELGDNARLRAGIGLVAHSSYLYGSLSAQENLDFYARLYGVKAREKRISEVLEMVGLTVRRHDRFATFSRGMQQRLSLARALLHNPSVLLLDEPETGLDQQALDSLWQIIRWDEEKRTVVFTSHNFERALGVCSAVVILERGRVAFSERACNLDLSTLRQRYGESAGAVKP